MKQFLFLIILSLLTILIIAQPQTYSKNIEQLYQLKNIMQAKVKQIAKQLQIKYAQNCTDQLKQCETKTYNLCQGTFYRQCFQNFPTPTGCLNQGIMLSKSSGVRIPNIFDINNLNFQTRLFICTSALVQQVFNRRNDDNLQYTYMYIGSSSGAIRISPSFKQMRGSDGKKCVDYDPRIRPWYVSSITGRKTTIILFDISKTMTSMHPGMRFKNALVTIQTIFATLNNFDNVGLVLFSKNATTFGFPTIFQANQNNKNYILSQIQKIQTQDGITNYTAAIELGISLLNNYQINCTSIIFLLLTDGYSQNDPIHTYYQTIPKLLQQKQKQKIIKLVSFVYGVEQNIKYSLVSNLTYEYSGILFRIIDGIDNLTMIEKLSSYYAFISQGLATRTQPIWSSPYLDAFGFGTIISVTIPVYAHHMIPKIIGVVGIDVLMSRFINQQITQKKITDIFIKIPQCEETVLDNITLEYLRCKARNNSDKCDNITGATGARINYNEQNCNGIISRNVFYEFVQNGYMDETRCCGPTLNIFGIILGCSFACGFFVIFVMVLVKNGAILWVWNKKWRKKQVRMESVDNGSDISSQIGLIDPENKYKNAEDSGIKIYHQPQFVL